MDDRQVAGTQHSELILIIRHTSSNRPDRPVQVAVVSKKGRLLVIFYKAQITILYHCSDFDNRTEKSAKMTSYAKTRNKIKNPVHQIFTPIDSAVKSELFNSLQRLASQLHIVEKLYISLSRVLGIQKTYTCWYHTHRHSMQVTSTRKRGARASAFSNRFNVAGEFSHMRFTHVIF